MCYREGERERQRRRKIGVHTRSRTEKRKRKILSQKQKKKVTRRADGSFGSHVSEWEGGSGDWWGSGHRESRGPVTTAKLCKGQFYSFYYLLLLYTYAIVSALVADVPLIAVV